MRRREFVGSVGGIAAWPLIAGAARAALFQELIEVRPAWEATRRSACASEGSQV